MKKEEQEMTKMTKSISLFLSIVLVMQLVFPFTSVFAANTSTPTNVKINNYYPGNVQISWDTVSNATSYNIYKVSGEQKELLSQVKGKTNTSFLNLSEEVHQFAVTSVTSTGESQLSNVVEVDIVYPEFLPPSTLSSDVINGNSVVLNWERAPYAQYYMLYEVIDGQRKRLTTTSGLTFTVKNVSENIHVYEVTSYSNGSMGESKTATRIKVALIDQTVQAPVLNYVVNNETDIELKWPAVDYATSYEVYQLIDGNPSLVATTNENNAVFANLSNGEYSYEVKAVSDIFGESDYSNIVTVQIQSDSNAPVTTTNITNEWFNEQFAVELTATDDNQVNQTFYSVNGAEYADGTNFTVSEEGVNVVSFYSVDKAGNKEEVKTAEVKIDQSAPETTINSVDQWLKAGSVIELTAQDHVSGVGTTYYSINGSDYVEGNSIIVNDGNVNKVSFYSVDKAGNIEEVKTTEIMVDQTAPETKSNITDDWSNEYQVELTATDNNSGVDKTFYSVNGSEYVEGTSFTITEEGVNDVAYYSIDTAGNKEEAKTIKVKIDQSTPETGSNVTGDWTKEFKVELTATDSGSGIATTYYSVNGSEYVEGTSFTVSEAGINKVWFYSVDKTGNKEEVKTAEVKIDQTAPETTTNIVGQWSKEAVVIDLTAVDNGSGEATTYYSVNGSEYVEGTNFTVSEQGINKVSFYSVDNAGNNEMLNTAEVKIDQSVPTVSMELNDAYALGAKLPLTYIAKDNASGIAVESLTVNGKNYANGDSISFNQPGKYHVQVTVTDNAGLTTTLEKTIVVYIPVKSFKVNPGVIKDNNGVFTVEVSLPKGFDTEDIVLESVTINGVSAISGKKGDEKQAENGQFRFNREDFDWNEGEQALEFSGMLGEHLVVGYTTVEVKGSSKKNSSKGNYHGFGLLELISKWIKGLYN